MDLFEKQSDRNHLLPPLAERMRPLKIEGFIGQEHLTAKGKILQRSLEQGKVFSMILWGPPGSGKTTLAKIIANRVKAQFFQISAVSAGVKDIRNVIKHAEDNHRKGITTILFIDEIHRFNKAQQDALLQVVEKGLLILIGATTENPSFEVISPLLSRCRVLKLNPLSSEDLTQILNSALSEDIILNQYSIQLDWQTRDYLIRSVNGDARKLLNALEISLQLLKIEKGEPVEITLELIKEALQQRHLLYDKKGDYHYDVISAFIKSVRGSDPDAAVYWLAVMIENGEDPLFVARRLVILASEDIGNASPLALTVATAGFQAVHSVGMPEAAIILAQVTTYLAASPKSNAAYLSLENALTAIKSGELPDVPLHLRNAPTGLMRALNYGKDYSYPHNHPDSFVHENYFPVSFENPGFYFPKDSGVEKFIRQRLEKLWPERYSPKKKK
jgi:putative ATPase